MEILPSDKLARSHGVMLEYPRKRDQSQGHQLFRKHQNHLERFRRGDEMTGALENQLSSVTLYERLGASAGIRALVDAAFDVLSHNPTLTPRFLALVQSADRLDDIKQQVCIFASARSGGPVEVAGHSMTKALCALNISDAEYRAAVEDIVATMTTRGYDDRTRSEVLAILNFMKADIVPS